MYLRKSLTFPYAAGLRFQDAVYRRVGRAGFAEVFRRAPRKLAEGTLGEFDYGILIHQTSGGEEGEVLARRLRGSAYVLLESKKDRHPLLAFASVWGDEEAAKNFLERYRLGTRTGSRVDVLVGSKQKMPGGW